MTETTTIMDTSKTPATLGSNISTVRKRRRMTQDVLAQKVDVTRQTLASYEKDITSPSAAVIRRIAKALEFPFESLLSEIKPFDYFNCGFEIIGSSFENSVQYRCKECLDPETEEMVRHVSFDAIRTLFELEEILQDRIEFSNPIRGFGEIKSKAQAEEAALEVRKKWGIYDTAFTCVVAALENKGVKVIEFDGPKNFEGLSARFEGNPIIVLNSAITAITRKRFTALHELGHLILQIPESVDYEMVERICNAFASTLILPKELLWQELGRSRSAVSLEELKLIRLKYGISIRAIIYSAVFAEIISWKKANEIIKELPGKTFGKLGGEESATRHDQLLYRAVIEKKITQDKYEKLGGSGDMYHQLIAL